MSLVDRVSDKILRTMIARDISQRELADRLGVSEARVCQMLGKANLTLRTVDKVFTALSTPSTLAEIATLNEEDGK